MWELKKKKRSQIFVKGTLGSNPLSAPKSIKCSKVQSPNYLILKIKCMGSIYVNDKGPLVA